MIFDKPPATWEELQTLVHRAFVEMGCKAESPKTVTLVRGHKEVDVWVQDVRDGIVVLYFIECKLWNSKVPQDVVHSFRTVVADGGAHKGIIICQKGFQRGAYAAAEISNVDLLTWEEFNQRFFQRWKKAVDTELVEIARGVREFSGNPYYRFNDRFERDWSEPLVEGWIKLRDVASMTGGAASSNLLDDLDAGPARIVRPEFDPKSEKITAANMFITFRTHREWYEYIKPRLLSLRQAIDDWYALYQREGGDAAFRTSKTIDDD